MAIKNFKTRNGIDVDTYTVPNTVIQGTVKTNSATTIDTIAMASFTSAEYLVTITQGSKIRTSKAVMHTDGTSVDMTEYGITETGGAISGVVVSATTSSTNAVLQVTITDAASTIARVKMSRNLNVIYTPTVPDAPTIGTATSSDLTASVPFTAPYDNGGSSITGYIAISSPGSITGTGSSSPISVSNLTDSTPYTFVVKAINSVGTSVASSESNSITPSALSYFGLFNVGNTLYKWDFATDTVSTVSATLTNNGNYMPGHSNVGTAGYTSSGASGSLTWGTKIFYSPITTSAMAAAPLARNQPSGGAGNTGSAGYVFGGTGVNIQTSTNKVSYSNDVQSTLNNSGSHILVGGAAASNVGVAALIQRSNSSGNLRKMSYSNETVADAGNFPTTSGATAGVATNGNTAAYFYFGYTTALSAVVHKVLFSNDTTSSLASTATPARYFSTGIYRTGQAGYFLGGNNLLGSTNKISFSTDTFSVSTTVNTGVSIANSSTSVSNGG